MNDHPEEQLSMLRRERCEEAVLQRALERVRASEPERQLSQLPRVEAPARVVQSSLWLTRLMRLNRLFSGQAVRRAGLLVPALAAAAIIAMLVLPDTAENVTEPAVSTVVVRAAAGTCTLVRGGNLLPVAAGLEVSDGDTLVTSAASSLTLSVGDHARVQIDDHSRVRFRQPAERVAELTVLQGRAQGRILAVSSDVLGFANRDRIMQLLRGGIGVLRSAKDEVVVAALQDSTVIVDGEPVELAAGHLVRISGAGPLRPEAVPRDVAIALQQVRPIGNGEQEVVLSGETSPEVVLIINDVPIPLDASGRFVATIGISDDAQTVEARARDPLGRDHHMQLTLTRAATRARWKKAG